jgi:transposase
LYRVHLTEEQRQELKQRTRAPGVMPRTRDRLEMVRLADVGWSIPQIARHLQQSEARVRFWIKQFLQEGFDALPDQPHPGPPSQLTPELVRALRQELEKGDRTWTTGQLAAWLVEQHGVRLSADWLGRLLKRAQVSYKRTQRRVQHQQDPGQVAGKAAELKELEKGERPVAWTSAISMRQVLRPPCPRAIAGVWLGNGWWFPMKRPRDGG